MLPLGTRFGFLRRNEEHLLCLVGLGNPGREYANHRHNIGFRLVDRYAERIDVSSPSRNSLFHYGRATVDGRTLAVCKPQTYMNRSGRAVEVLVRKYGWEPQDFIVVYDDVSIPLGTLRLRSKGSSGGHNGVQSIADTLGTDRFPRLRFGVGPVSEALDLADFVLSDFPEPDRALVEKTMERACDAITFAALHGIERTMNVFNNAMLTNQEQ